MHIKGQNIWTYILIFLISMVLRHIQMESLFLVVIMFVGRRLLVANANTGKNESPKIQTFIVEYEVAEMPSTIVAANPLKIADIVDILQTGSCTIYRYSFFPSGLILTPFSETFHYQSKILVIS